MVLLVKVPLLPWNNLSSASYCWSMARRIGPVLLVAGVLSGCGVASHYSVDDATDRHRCRCRQGDGASCVVLGDRLMRGLADGCSPCLAASYYDAACAYGYAPGCVRLGLLYERGLGVRRDPAAARECFGMAAVYSEEGCRTLQGRPGTRSNRRIRRTRERRRSVWRPLPRTAPFGASQLRRRRAAASFKRSAHPQ